jgi:hypothetical protein
LADAFFRLLFDALQKAKPFVEGVPLQADAWAVGRFVRSKRHFQRNSQRFPTPQTRISSGSSSRENATLKLIL